MTVITTLITRAGTVHATDSLITQLRSDGRREPIEWQTTKLIPVVHFRGAMSYWGLAVIESGWSTLGWLRDRASEAAAFPSPEVFAHNLAQQLARALASFHFQRDVDSGIGIHFTSYERVNDRWVPELFLISNWADPSNSALRPTGIGASRETHHTLLGTPTNPADGLPERREVVGRFLDGGDWFRYNNGDPALYNPIANALMDLFQRTRGRGMLRDIETPDVLRAMARLPVEFVSRFQQDFLRPEARVVGGRIHDLVITPAGFYSSSSGDAP